MQAVLSTGSNLVFVWHDNAGQSFPTNAKHIQTRVDTQGFTIDIEANADISEPIIILTSAGSDNTAKNTINLGKGCKVQIVEYLMSVDVDANNNVATVINCGENATLKHCILHQA